jgi:hypothetical protein
MANEQNLKPRELTSEEATEMGKRGGIASGKARREKKLMREQLEILLNLPIKNTKVKEQLKHLGLEDDEMTNQMALITAMYQKALKGDVQAFNTLRDTSGQKPIEILETREAPKIVDDI